ncbi:hypothetical protein D1872_288930 [compost metagenome]
MIILPAIKTAITVYIVSLNGKYSSEMVSTTASRRINTVPILMPDHWLINRDKISSPPVAPPLRMTRPAPKPVNRPDKRAASGKLAPRSICSGENRSQRS